LLANLVDTGKRGVARSGDLPQQLEEDRAGAGGDDDDERNYGFAGEFAGWQQSQQATVGEEFADMFIGWNYNKWEANPSDQDYRLGQARATFMESHMKWWITAVINRNKKNAQ
jgi:hypothetical protein